MKNSIVVSDNHVPWNKGKLIGQRPALKLKEVWAIRIRLQISKNIQELALFNLAIDSKLRSCDLVRLKVSDISSFDSVSSRAKVMQQKTQMPVQFEITPGTRDSLQEHIANSKLKMDDYLFKSRLSRSDHISTRQYGRLVRDWVEAIGLEPSGYGTHSMRRTKAAEIYRKTGNLRAVQLLLGHTKIDSTVRYLGVEVEDALSIAEKIDI